MKKKMTIEEFKKYNIPTIVPNTKDMNQIRVDWCICLLAMNDLEIVCDMTTEQANEHRNNFIWEYVQCLQTATDRQLQTFMTVKKDWEQKIAHCKKVDRFLDSRSNVVAQLEFQKEIELSYIFGKAVCYVV